jgi:hypothetical protein
MDVGDTLSGSVDISESITRGLQAATERFQERARKVLSGRPGAAAVH